MKHHYTSEEMGEGFAYTKKEHKENEYNYLVNVKLHEKNTMRTCYLIRDVWNKKQLIELKDFLDEHLTELLNDEFLNTYKEEEGIIS
tara:strand:+ start:632 stop:892 length:261 start_codon:yes stop_codon:yes gene_type:complete